MNKLVQLADDLLQHLNLFLGIAIGLQTLFDAGCRMDGGRMVAIEFLADIAVGEVEQLSAQVDGDLSRSHNGLGSLWAYHVAMAHFEEVLHFALDVLHGQAS